MGVRERLANLRRNLEGRRVVDFALAQCLSQRPAGDVFVSDVDVAGVARERIGALAPRVTKTGCCGGLALGPRSCLALARDDLERDLGSGRLVPGEPDRARAAAAERLQRAIPAEDELVRGDGESRF